MKIRSILLAGAVATLPLAAFAQQQPPPEPPKQPSQQQVTMNESGDMKVVTITGTVQSFEAGHSITITNDKGEQATYTINESSNVPKTVEVGKTVTINTTTVSGAPVVKTITITTTKETKRKSY